MTSFAKQRKLERDARFIAEAAYCKENGHRRYGCDTSITILDRDGATLMPLTEFMLISYEYSDSPEEVHIHDVDKIKINALADAIKNDSECTIVITKVTKEHEVILAARSDTTPNMNNLPTIISEPTEDSIAVTQPAYDTVETYQTCQFVYNDNAIHTLRGHLVSSHTTTYKEEEDV
jgi:hypothetical protein